MIAEVTRPSGGGRKACAGVSRESELRFVQPLAG
jgi:hypothetical protein